MTYDTRKTAERWDRHTEHFAGRTSGLYWFEVAEVMRGMNQRISGDPNTDWVTYTTGKYLNGKLPVERMLSLGCGTGDLERTLSKLNAFRQCDAYDISPRTIETARAAARREGFDHIQYEVMDINEMKLSPHPYDTVWAYGSMHHFVRLEHIAREVSRALRPGGIFVLNEYVGPARFQFDERQKEIVNACLQLIPLRYRRVLDEAVKQERGVVNSSAPSILNRIRGFFQLAEEPQVEVPQQEVFRTMVGFPTSEAVEADDPSESIRSNDILGTIAEHFDIVEKSLWGGNILQFLLSGIAGNFQDDDPSATALIQLLWKIEETLLDCDELRSDFAYIVARSKQKDDS